MYAGLCTAFSRRFNVPKLERNETAFLLERVEDTGGAGQPWKEVWISRSLPTRLVRLIFSGWQYVLRICPLVSHGYISDFLAFCYHVRRPPSLPTDRFDHSAGRAKGIAARHQASRCFAIHPDLGFFGGHERMVKRHHDLQTKLLQSPP